jgi:capsular polysaccharide biosynthesis protein
VTDRDQKVVFSLNGGNGEPDRLGVFDDFSATENATVDFVPGLVSLGFIGAAIRRSARFLFVMAVVGLLVGGAVYKETPHPYQASASILLTLSPYENSQTAAADNQALAQTRTVAGLAEQALGLQQSVGSFLSTYIVTPVTDRVMTITASAPSADQAVLRANALGTAFLKFRGEELQAQQNLVLQSIEQQVSQDKQRVDSINAQISQLTASGQQAQLSKLRTEQISATAALGTAQQVASSNQTTVQPALTAALKGSEILSVAALPRSKLKSSASYVVIGLISGLVLGLAIVIIRVLVSDRLRRRDDVAYVLEAPVKLSVGTLGARRWIPAGPRRARKRDLDMQRVVTHLERTLPRSTGGVPDLAIVAVDNAPVVAPAAAALATSYASQGNQVIVADLSQGADLARLLGVKSPGVQAVSHQGANFTVAVPDRDDVAPVGPLRPVTSTAGPAQAEHALSASYASADLLLTLVTLDPALGGDHLATWATNAVVVVSAGESSAERIHGVGEMIRLAGTRLDSAVLIGADKSDESLGLTPRPDEQAGIGLLGR